MNEKEKPENPFGTKKPVSGKNFIGRERLLREINNLLNRSECISLVGERRTGKTSILNYLLELKEQQISYHDYIFVFIDFHDKFYSKESGIWISVLSDMLKEIDRLKLENKYLLELIDNLKIGEFEDSFSDDFTELLITYGNMGWKFCLLFDEFEKTVNMFDPSLYKADLRFYKILRKVASRKETKLSYIIATRQPLDEVEWNIEKKYRSLISPISLSSPLYNIFNKLTITLFSKDEAQKLVINRLESTGISSVTKTNFWLQHDFLFQLSGFHPFFLEIACYYLFEYCILLDKTFISDIPKDKIISDFLKEAGAFFDFYWEVSSDKEKKVMRWLSKNVGIDNQIYSSVLRTLEERCLIIRDGKNINIFSSAFGMWIEEKAFNPFDKTNANDEPNLPEYFVEQEKAFSSLAFNPFEKTNANDEPNLPEYFVEPDIFEQLKALKSTILFAPEGWGKTACCRMLKYVCKSKIDIPGNIRTINYNDSGFNKIIENFKSLGFDYLFILMDNVHNLSEVNRLIESNGLNNEGIYFKLFLPSELQDHVNQSPSLKNFEKLHLKWQKEKLKEILEQRLKAASKECIGIQVKSLAQVSDGRLSDKLDDIIIEKSESPRKLIENCHTVLELCRVLPKDNFITDRIFKSLFPDEEKEKLESYQPTKVPSPPKTETVYILHISDIHLQKSGDATVYQNQLLTDLVKNIKLERLDYIVITGDIANFATEEEYKAASKFINKIMNHFNIEKKNIIISPGNHDLNWDMSKNAYIELRKNKPKDLKEGRYTLIKDDKNAEVVRRYNSIDALLRNDMLHQKRFNFFADFYERICSNSYPLNYEQQGILHIFPNDKLILLTLNSSWEIDHLFRNKASINITALSNALDELLKKEYRDWLKIALWHHPIKMMKDDFMQQLATHGFEICMHGCIHEALQDFHYFDPKRGIHIIGAGTFGAPSKDMVTGIPHQYNLLIYDKQNKKITVKTRKKERAEGAWMADARWGDKENPLPYYEIKLS